MSGLQFVTTDLYPTYRVFDQKGSGLEIAGSGVQLAGSGFGKGTRKKIGKAIKTAGKVGKVGVNLANAFLADDDPRKKQINDVAANVSLGHEIITGSGCKNPPLPAAKLRRLMN